MEALSIAYLCCKIPDHGRSAEMVTAKGVAPTHYFPAYRKGEFV